MERPTAVFILGTPDEKGAHIHEFVPAVCFPSSSSVLPPVIHFTEFWQEAQLKL